MPVAFLMPSSMVRSALILSGTWDFISDSFWTCALSASGPIEA
jgi:hypothetical protein